MLSLHLTCSQLRPPAAAAAFRHRLAGPRSIPARDKVIDFGKHKGRMLGSLPSSYLQWVSRNLRARDFKEWAYLADEVLQDPVYRDRMEWEAAERILTGNARRRDSSYGPAESPVADLIEVSERFGWDNEDKDAWARIDFQLLGTSKGGCIPRVGSPSGREETEGGNFRGDSKLASGSRPGPKKKSVVWVGKSVASGSVDAASSASTQWHAVAKKGGILSGNAMVSSDLRLSIPSNEGKVGASATDSTTREQRKDGPLRGDSTGLRDESTGRGRKVGFLIKGQTFVIGGGGGGGGEEEERKGMEVAAKSGNKEDRRERRRLKREQQLEMLRREVGVVEASGRSNEALVKKGFLRDEQIATNPFPGRRALLEKVRETGSLRRN